MPLHLLVPLIVGGIFALMIAIVVKGRNKPRRFESDADARYAWQRAFPGRPVTDLRLATARTAALIETDDGPGLVWTRGKDTLARLLTDATADTTDSGLTLHLPDAAVHLSLTPQEARDWARRITEITA
ncbi:hypothetical protein ACN2XU_11120 [Primorskyibacter sp. 2E107]|uniref:hypothetical protein n=1 Tax=Primorskyibacter sp. 2E107 TaxID=3403458 RepID=UPI003AF84F9A